VPKKSGTQPVPPSNSGDQENPAFVDPELPIYRTRPKKMSGCGGGDGWGRPVVYFTGYGLMWHESIGPRNSFKELQGKLVVRNYTGIDPKRQDSTTTARNRKSQGGRKRLRKPIGRNAKSVAGGASTRRQRYIDPTSLPVT